MPEAQLLNPRKRRSSERPTPQQNEVLLHDSKRQKRSHLSRYLFPPAFWDNLSKIDLTKRALEELDRRNTEATQKSGPAHLRSQRPITRRERTQLKESCQPHISAADYLGHCSKWSLKSIKQSARHGGPDLSELRGYPNPEMSSTQPNFRVPRRKSKPTPGAKPPTETAKTTTTASTGPYNRNFQQSLIEGGIYPPDYDYRDGRVTPPPANWEEINSRLERSRRSLSPSRFSDADFREFRRANARAKDESQVQDSVFPIIGGDIGKSGSRAGQVPFRNLDPLTDGSLVPGNPDIYYGSRPKELDQQVRDKLSGHIVPTTLADRPIIPNFVVELKGPDGAPAVAKRQACYYGALGARGIHSLQSYGQDNPSYNNKAYTLSSTYFDGTLKMYTSHPSQPTKPGGPPEYHMHEICNWGMSGNIEQFRQGAKFYRNGMEWAEEQRDDAIRIANERVRAGGCLSETLAVESGSIQASSFISERSSDAISTIEAPSEGFRASRAKNSDTTAQLQTNGTSLGELVENNRASIKRSIEHPKGSQRKRRNNGE